MKQGASVLFGLQWEDMQATFRSVMGWAQCDKTPRSQGSLPEAATSRLRTEAWGEAGWHRSETGRMKGWSNRWNYARKACGVGRAACHTHRRDRGLQTPSTGMQQILRHKQEATQLQREAGCEAQVQRWGILRTLAKSSHVDDCMPGRLVCSPCSLSPVPPSHPGSQRAASAALLNITDLSN